MLDPPRMLQVLERFDLCEEANGERKKFVERENREEDNGEGNPVGRRREEEAEENRENREEEVVVVKEKAVSMRKRP
ncbi:hypothetical protein AMTR_s00090p00147630 [Amborella trichopoda]|uniref:Uncharacterized protein n=1 Tax=Amborella trichopoda TaxID=13333 RepID=W1P2A0_AMBTC|nr:hypothetical protein AMTR_s00090p00147630 [Amborella trichopoda]